MTLKSVESNMLGNIFFGRGIYFTLEWSLWRHLSNEVTTTTLKGIILPISFTLFLDNFFLMVLSFFLFFFSYSRKWNPPLIFYGSWKRNKELVKVGREYKTDFIIFLLIHGICFIVSILYIYIYICLLWQKNSQII